MIAQADAQLNGAADANPRRVSRSLLLYRVRVGAAERQAVRRTVETHGDFTREALGGRGGSW